jgi:hypothetical protein
MASFPLMTAEIVVSHEDTFPSRTDDYGPRLRGSIPSWADPNWTWRLHLQAQPARLRFRRRSF